jgi:hypothetical protein
MNHDGIKVMPTTLFYGPYRFSFFSLDCKELRHTHVWRDEQEAKFGLDPVRLAYNHGFSRKELKAIERIVREKIFILRERWDEHCGSRLA